MAAVSGSISSRARGAASLSHVGITADDSQQNCNVMGSDRDPSVMSHPAGPDLRKSRMVHAAERMCAAIARMIKTYKLRYRDGANAQAGTVAAHGVR
jgi:hypothetical protein